MTTKNEQKLPGNTSLPSQKDTLDALILLDSIHELVLENELKIVVF